MKIFKGIRGISKLVLILLLLISFVTGAILSYVWTMGYYAPSEYLLPSQANVTIEKVQFFLENATFFNVTVLNPSYSSDVTIEQIKVETTVDGKLHNTTTLSLPGFQLARSTSQTFMSLWNWCNYTGQTVRIHVYVSEGTTAGLQAITPFMNFKVTNVNLDSSVSGKYFNITVQNAGSSTFLNITEILVNGASVLTTPAITPSYGLSNATDAPPVTFMINRTWIDLQGLSVTVAVQTMQGYTAYKTLSAPRVSLKIIPPVVFNETDTSHFNITVLNEPISPGYVTLNEVEITVFKNNTLDKIVLLDSTKLVADPSLRIEPSTYPTRLVCYWDWSEYRGTGATMTVTVRTIQGFETPPLFDTRIP